MIFYYNRQDIDKLCITAKTHKQHKHILSLKTLLFSKKTTIFAYITKNKQMKNIIALIILFTYVTMSAQLPEPQEIKDLSNDTDMYFDSYIEPSFFTETFGVFAIESESQGTELGAIINNEFILLKDINPGENDSDPGYFVEYKGNVYFSAYNGEKAGIWKTDGTTDGTMEVFAIESYPTTPPKGLIVSKSGSLYFTYNNKLYQWNGENYAIIADNASFNYDMYSKTNQYCTYKDEIAYMHYNYDTDRVEVYAVIDGKIELLTLQPSIYDYSKSNYFGISEVLGGLLFCLYNIDDLSISGAFVYRNSTQETIKLTMNGETLAPEDMININSEKDIVLVRQKGFYTVDGTSNDAHFLAPVAESESYGFELDGVSYNGHALFNSDAGFFGDSHLLYTDGTQEGTKELCEIDPYSENFVQYKNYAFYATGTSNGFHPKIAMVDMNNGNCRTLLSLDHTAKITLLGVLNDTLYYRSYLFDGKEAIYSLCINATLPANSETTNVLLISHNIWLGPTPTKGQVTLRMNEVNAETKIEVTTISGTKIWEKSILSVPEYSFEINGSPNIYCVKVTTSMGSTTFRIAKE